MSTASGARVETGRDEWAAALTGADDRWLMGLLASRPDLLLTGLSDLTDLAESVVSPGSVRACYEAADRPTRQVLEALCVLPDPTDIEAVAGALGVLPGPLGPVVERLSAAGLVLARGGCLVPNPGLRAAIPHPAGLGPSARAVIANQPVRALADIALRLGLAVKGAKGVLVEALIGALSSPDLVAGLVAAGPEGTAEIAGRMAGEYLELEFSYGTYQSSQSDRTAAGWLLRRGLLVATGWASATMPAEVAIALRGGRLFDSFQADPPYIVPVPVDAERVDQRAAETALRLVSDVAAVLDAWSAQPAKLLQAGGLGTREVRRVAKLTGRPETQTARLIELAMCAGLADLDGDVALPTPEYDEWLQLAVESRWQQLALAWYLAPLHVSLAGAIDTKDKPIPPLLDRPPEAVSVPRRILVLGLLGTVPPGQALAAADVIIRAEWHAPALWHGGPARPQQLVSWVLEEAELIGVTVGGALSSFGRVIAGGDGEGAAVALRAFCPPVTSEVVLQADLTAVAAGELEPGLRRELDLLAEVESSGAATVYRFGEGSLRRGFDAGYTADQILALLSGHAPRGVPQPLRYLVEDLGRRFGQVRVGVASSYLRSEDPALLAEVVRGKRAARLGLRLLAPTVAVTDADPVLVLGTLREAGYLAAAEDHDAALVVTRPPVRRAPPGDADPTDEDRLEALLADPDLLAALGGLAPAAVAAGLAGERRGVATGEFDPTDLASVVEGLRHRPPRRPGSPGGPRMRGAGGRRDLPFSQLHLLDAQAPRPDHIAQDPPSVGELLVLALAEDWLVRLSYVNSRGEESEFYAEVVDARRHSVKVRRLPRGNVQELVPYRIQWARIATEAEEEAQLL